MTQNVKTKQLVEHHKNSVNRMEMLTTKQGPDCSRKKSRVKGFSGLILNSREGTGQGSGLTHECPEIKKCSPQEILDDVS